MRYSLCFHNKRAKKFFLIFALLSPQIYAATATAGFTGGAIAEYTNNAHQPNDATLLSFSTLNITEAIISDETDDGTFGGTQGNDYDVTLTLRYSNGTVKSFNASVNWRDTQGKTLYGIGLTTLGSADDGSSYSLTNNTYSKTYILEASNSAYADGGGLLGSGNAATTGLLDALNSYANNVAASDTPSVLSSTITAADSTISADGISTTTITVQLQDVNGNNINSGGETIVISSTKGTMSGTTDNEDGTYTATLTSSNIVETASVTATLNGSAINDSDSVDFTAVDDTAPVITGPSGAAGDATSAISVNEEQTTVTTFTANEAVTWSITGGDDQGQFTIDANTGAITFNPAPDFENPVDANTDNDYLVTVTATDADNNTSTQTLTVTVLDLDDTAPVITGINIDQNIITVLENNSSIISLSANEEVAWTIPGGSDAALLSISTKGELRFINSPDYENPVDINTDNDYELIIRATDLAGNFAKLNLIVRVINKDEVRAKLREIKDDLQSGLQNYVLRSLSDSLSFNESQVRKKRDLCVINDDKLNWDISPAGKSLNASLNYQNQLTNCEEDTRVYLEAGVVSSENIQNIDDVIDRGFLSLITEKDFNNNITAGLGLRLSFADGKIARFEDSSIEDHTAEIHTYLTRDIDDSLRVGVFGSLGKSWYEFNLNDDGFLLDGKMDGKRKVFGTIVSGDFLIKQQSFTTDLIYSRSTEDINYASLNARYLGESLNDILFYIGELEADRLSIPVSTDLIISRQENTEKALSEASIAFGLLCEDNQLFTDDLECGYQANVSYRALFGKKLSKNLSINYAYEKINEFKRDKISLGIDSVFGNKSQLTFSSNLGLIGQNVESSLYIELGFNFYLF